MSGRNAQMLGLIPNGFADYGVEIVPMGWIDSNGVFPNGVVSIV